MRIGIWAPKSDLPFASYTRVDTRLVVVAGVKTGQFLARPFDKAYGLTIPVDKEFGCALLGARENPCPYSGQSPKDGFHWSGYTRYPYETRDEDIALMEECSVCGWTNPQNMGDAPTVHPDTSYPIPTRERTTIREGVTWGEGNRLAEGDNNGTLGIWIKTSWHYGGKSAERAMSKKIPGAKTVYDGGSYLVFRLNPR